MTDCSKMTNYHEIPLCEWVTGGGAMWALWRCVFVCHLAMTERGRARKRSSFWCIDNVDNNTEYWNHFQYSASVCIEKSTKLLQMCCRGDGTDRCTVGPWQVVTRLIHLLGQKILGNLQQGQGPFAGEMMTGGPGSVVLNIDGFIMFHLHATVLLDDSSSFRLHTIVLLE